MDENIRIIVGLLMVAAAIGIRSCERWVAEPKSSAAVYDLPFLIEWYQDSRYFCRVNSDAHNMKCV